MPCPPRNDEEDGPGNPARHEFLPVNIAARDGEQIGAAASNCVNRVPTAAMASMFGVTG
jgi:hypothetical protein